MASPSEQEEFEFRRRAEAEAKARTATPSVASELGRAAYNTPGSVVDLVANTAKGIGSAIAHPIETGTRMAAQGENLENAVSGVIDNATKGHPVLRKVLGVPGAATDEADANARALANAKTDLGNKYGTPRRALKTFADDPAPTLATVASVAVPALRATGADRALAEGAGKAAEAVGRAAPEPVRNLVTAERRAQSASNEMAGQSQAALEARQAALDATTRANEAKAAALLEKQKKAASAGHIRLTQKYAKERAALLPELDVGTPRHLSEIGDVVRDPALEAAEGINARGRAKDTELRSIMEQSAADRALAGEGISDVPEAKSLLEESKAKVDPDPATRPAIGNPLADSAGGKLHKLVIDALSEKRVPLTADQAALAKAQGHEVFGSGQDFYRIIKPGLQDVDNLRRFLREAATRDIEGYGGLIKKEASDLYGRVSKVQDEYVKGASAEVQSNWRMMQKALEPTDKIRMGQTLTGTQGGTAEHAVPASSIPGRMIAGGRDSLSQVEMAAGAKPTGEALRSIVQNELGPLKKSSAIESAIAPGTTLGDAIATDGSLEAAVREHIARVKAAEQAGTEAEVLGKKSDANFKRATNYEGIAKKLQGEAEKTAMNSRKIEGDLAQLEIEDPKNVGARYTKILDEELAAGRMTGEQYRQGLALARTAEDAFKLKATRERWLGEAMYLGGGAAMGAHFGLPGMAAGAGLGYAARFARVKAFKAMRGH